MKAADMHCDTILEIMDSKKKKENLNLRENNLHIDLIKLKKGDYLLQNFAMFIDLLLYDNPFEYCLEMIDLYYKELEKNKDLILPVYTYKDIISNYKTGHMSALLAIEEGGVLKGSLSNLRNFYRLGVRMLTLTWNYINEIGYPNAVKTDNIDELYGMYNDKNGLSCFGIECIGEMEKLGIIIDVSHLSDAGFYDVLKYTKKPFTASHSNSRSISSHARNMSDDMIKALSMRGGVMGICYHPPFLINQLSSSEEAMHAGIGRIVEHIKYIKNIAGYECIGLGSDFDGMKPNVDMKDASCLPILEDELWKSGFCGEQIEAIFHKNVLRLYKEILK